MDMYDIQVALDKQEQQVRENFGMDILTVFVKNMCLILWEDKFSADYDTYFSDAELQEIVTRVFTKYTHSCRLFDSSNDLGQYLSGMAQDDIESVMSELLDERVQYYPVDLHIESDITIMVRAKSESEARNCAEHLRVSDIGDLAIDSADIDVTYISSPVEDFDEFDYGEAFDAEDY